MAAALVAVAVAAVADFNKFCIKLHLLQKCETMVKSARFYLSLFSSYQASKSNRIGEKNTRNVDCSV